MTALIIFWLFSNYRNKVYSELLVVVSQISLPIYTGLCRNQECFLKYGILFEIILTRLKYTGMLNATASLLQNALWFYCIFTKNMPNTTFYNFHSNKNQTFSMLKKSANLLKNLSKIYYIRNFGILALKLLFFKFFVEEK